MPIRRLLTIMLAASFAAALAVLTYFGATNNGGPGNTLYRADGGPSVFYRS